MGTESRLQKLERRVSDLEAMFSRIPVRHASGGSGSGGAVGIAKLTEVLTSGDTAEAKLLKVHPDEFEETATITVSDEALVFIPAGQQLPVDTVVTVRFVKGHWHLDGYDCDDLEDEP